MTPPHCHPKDRSAHVSGPYAVKKNCFYRKSMAAITDSGFKSNNTSMVKVTSKLAP